MRKKTVLINLIIPIVLLFIGASGIAFLLWNQMYDNIIFFIVLDISALTWLIIFTVVFICNFIYSKKLKKEQENM